MSDRRAALVTARAVTSASSPSPPPQAKAHGLPEERVLEEVILAPHAIKRLIEPEEVAYLLGPGGRTMTGVPLTMDLGWTAR